MNLSVQQKTSDQLVFYLNGSTHTLCNVLKDELWNDKSVTAAAYTIDHPLTGQPKFIIQTKGKAPEKALVDAIARLQKKNKEFSGLFAKAK